MAMRFKNILSFSGLLFLSLSIYNCEAQTYKPNQMVNVGGGQVLKIVKCKGEGATQECEIKHFVNNKQVGSSFWLTSASIAVQQKTYLSKSVAAKPKAPAANPTIVRTKTSVAKTPITKPPVESSRMAKIESSLNHADMLALAKAAAEQYQPPVVVEAKKPEAQPKKVKKEFVSHNPYLLKQYKTGDATVKQSPEPGKE